jgi:hypothetical protein
MSGERADRVALRTYPPAFRRERGDEILATLAESGGRVAAREVLGLLAGGLRERGAADRRAGFRGTAAAAARLAALVLLLLEALVSLAEVAQRAAAHWRVGAWASAGGSAPLGRHDLAVLAAGLLPLAASALLCRGRSLAAATLAATGVALLATGAFGLPAEVALGARGLASLHALEIAWLVGCAVPAVLAYAAHREPAVRMSPAWLAAPVVVALAAPWFWVTSLTFWPLGTLVVVLFGLAPLRPALGLAAALVTLPVVAVIGPFALVAPEYQYATAVVEGGLVLALAAPVHGLLGERRRAGRI